MICVVFYDATNLVEFSTRLLAEPGIVLATTTLLLVELLDAARYARQVRDGYRAPAANLQPTFLRVGVLIVPAALLHAVGAPPAPAGAIMLCAMLPSIVLFEGLPQAAKALMPRRAHGG